MFRLVVEYVVWSLTLDLSTTVIMGTALRARVLFQLKLGLFCHISVPHRNERASRVEIPLKNRSRYERFEWFFSKIGKTARTAQILLEKPLKNGSFLAVTFERFFKQDLSVF